MPSLFFSLAVWTLQLLILSRCHSVDVSSTGNSSGDQIRVRPHLFNPTVSYPPEDLHQQFIQPTQYDCPFDCSSYSGYEKLACIQWKQQPEQLQRCPREGSGEVAKEEDGGFEDSFEKMEEMAATGLRNGNYGYGAGNELKNEAESVHFDINKLIPPNNKEVVVNRDSIKTLEEVFEKRQKKKCFILIISFVTSVVVVIAVVAVIYIFCVKHKNGSRMFRRGINPSTSERSDIPNAI